MTDKDPATGGFYRTHPGGLVVCRLCDAIQPAHSAGCPVRTLRTQLGELSGQLGLYVATMREVLDALDQLLRGDPGDKG